jgi:hypothetical protein
MRAGGHQPYTRDGGREAGPALGAMLAGTSSMGNPQDVSRQTQKTAGQGPTVKPPPIPPLNRGLAARVLAARRQRSRPA